ncbi:MAG: hypothetical protein GY749_22720 [Desulfobacteraceae bacterium]|nr:hypothetical protein [Desulfobacteraceae bacterium]
MPFVPLAKGLTKVAQKGIKAYHGTPHSFDKFSMDKINTGEGAQAYGHGLYFAENEDVAKGYRDGLSPVPHKNKAEGHASFLLSASGGDVEKALKEAKWDAKTFSNDSDFGGTAQDAVKVIEEWKTNGLPASPGSMYEVNIDANPDDFLDWDKPLSDQQGVLKKLEPEMMDYLGSDDYETISMLRENAGFAPMDTGKDVYNTASRPIGMPDAEGDYARYSEVLREKGIPGIKYKDAGSRGIDGKGTNNYVVFDENLINIVKKYGIAGAVGLGLVSQADGEAIAAQINDRVSQSHDKDGMPQPVTPIVSEHDDIDPSFMEELGAAFRQENIVGSFVASETMGVSREIDDDFDLFDQFKVDGIDFDKLPEDEQDEYLRVFNKGHYDALQMDVQREKEDRDILDRGGWSAIGLRMGAAVLDPTIVIPGGAMVKTLKGAKVGYSSLKSAASIGTAAAVATGIQETGLQATQHKRTVEESAFAIGGAAILGGLVGAAGSKLFTKAEWNHVAKAIEADLGDETPHVAEVAQTIVSRAQAAGAQSADDISFDDLDIGGLKAAQVLANATNAIRLNPGVRTMLSPSKKTREIYAALVENPIYTKGNFEGKTTGPAVESLTKLHDRGALSSWLKDTRQFYKESRKAGENIPKDEFNKRVGRAMRNGDVDPDSDFITKSAQSARKKITDPLFGLATESNLLGKETNPNTSKTYFHRMWNKKRLQSEELEFKNVTREWLTEQISSVEVFEADKAKFAATRALSEATADDESLISTIKAAKNATAPKMRPHPAIDMLRDAGGVRIGSPLDTELRTIGLTPKRFPGLFKKDSGISAADNFERSTDGIFPSVRGVDANNTNADIYIDQDEFLEAVHAEFGGDPFRTFEEREILDATLGFADDLERYLDEIGLKLNDSEDVIRARLKELKDSDQMKQFKDSVPGLERSLPEHFEPDLDDLPNSIIGRSLDDIINEDSQMRRGFAISKRIKEGRESKIPQFVNADDKYDYIDEIVNSIFNNLTGRGNLEELPEWMVPTTRGPLKERVFKIPDERVEQWLEDDAEVVLRRYARTMGAEVELTGAFGKADMQEQLDQIGTEYTQLRNQILTDSSLDVKTRDKKIKKLESYEKDDLTNIAAFRDMIRGTYRADEQASNWGKATRLALTWNYIRLLGGVTLTSVTDVMRVPAVHGIRATMTEGLPQLVKAIRGTSLSINEAKELGPVTETFLQSRLASLAELHDPHAIGSPFERMMSNASNIFSKATGLGYWNDTWKGIGAVITQNRIIRNSLAGGYKNLDEFERPYMAMLKINENMSERIAKSYKTHGTKDGSAFVANTHLWDDTEARRVYAAALNLDVDRTIVTPGVADRPLFTRSNLGKLTFQFKSFGLASHQKILITGLQERPHRLAEMVVGATGLGMMIAYLKFIERGDTEKAEALLQNPGLWIADGFDRTGIASVPFDISNTMEKLGSPIGIKSGLQKLAGDERKGLDVSRYASRNKTGAIGGPWIGAIEDLVTIAEQVSKGDLKNSGANAMIRQIPGASLPGIRTGIHTVLKPALKDAVN